MKRTKQHTSAMGQYHKSNIYVLGIPGRRRKRQTEIVSEETMDKTFLKLIKYNKPQIQKAENTK